MCSDVETDMMSEELLNWSGIRLKIKVPGKVSEFRNKEIFKSSSAAVLPSSIQNNSLSTLLSLWDRSGRAELPSSVSVVGTCKVRTKVKNGNTIK